MNVYAWIVLVWLAVVALSGIAKVGKPRKPKLAWEAVVDTLEVGLIAWLVVLAVTA